jgi:catechol 2,3-dioxygenase
MMMNMNDFLTNNSKSILSKTLSMGVVQLNAKKIASLADFYSTVIGLEITKKAKDKVSLGNKNRPVLNLISTPELPSFAANGAGLYHFAILFSSREQLATTVQRILTIAPDSFIGSADHLVSEAFYFTDPEGNGIELYFDRPNNQWQWDNGQVIMGSTYIDPLQYIEQFAHKAGSEDTIIGHVHLQVGNIARAIDFYQNILGMYVTAQFPGAAFLSDGKYHHNLGLNTWNSNQAPARKKTTGLDFFEVIVAQAEDLAQLKLRLELSGLDYEKSATQLKINDPWNNTLVIRSNK